MNLYGPNARVVEASPEFYRVANLPRRVWSPESASRLAADMTAQLKTPDGAMSLRPVQAIALYELHMLRGLLGLMRVGSGKTLVSLLAPLMVSCLRPLLLVPAKLRDKTRADQRTLMQHWRIPVHLRIESYELLGRPQAADMLEQYQPDFVIADEAHKLRNPGAAVTRRVSRYVRARPDTIVAVMSGTLSKNSLRDYSRILRWCLGRDKAPIPATEQELEDWANALDDATDMIQTVLPGPLAMLGPPDEPDALVRARRGFHARLVQTPGVVASQDHRGTGASLVIAPVEVPMRPETDVAIAHLRGAWETPDGWPLADGFAVWRHVRELALGFYYRWNPRPPRPWLEARRLWAGTCRSIISHGRTYDSEAQVAEAAAAGYLGDEPRDIYAAWCVVAPTFTPCTEIVWLDDSVLRACATWAHASPGIVWTKHVFFATRLAQITGLTYYGRGGVDEAGTPIEAAPTTRSIIASIPSNAEGRNLQAWSRNLIVDPPSNGPQWEQLLARTHRDGQRADEVSFDVIMTCAEHYQGFDRARAQASYVEQTQGQMQKILYGTVLIGNADIEIAGRAGPRWQT